MTNARACYSHISLLGRQMRSGNRKPRGVLSNGISDPVPDSREIFARNLKFWLEKREMSGAETSKPSGMLPNALKSPLAISFMTRNSVLALPSLV